VLIRPVGSADNASPDLELEASTDPEGDAITYFYEVYSNEELSDIVTIGDTDATAWTVPLELSEDTWYWWRARAEDHLELSSDWAEPLRFLVNTENQLPEPPVIIKPEEGELVDTVPVELVWRHAVDPDGDQLSYSMQVVVTDSNVEVTALSDIPMGDLDTVTQFIEGLNEDIMYTARVTAWDPTGMGGTAEVTFTVNAENTPPKGLVIIRPRDGVQVRPGNVDLVFNPGFDPDGHNFHATVTVYEDYTRTQPVFTTTLENVEPATEIAVPWEASAEARSWYWTVSTIDEYDQPGPTAGPEEFVVASAAPTTPILISPIGGTAVDAESFEMMWHNAADEDGDLLTYTVRIHAEEDLSDAPLWSTTGLENAASGATTILVEDLETAGNTRLYWVVWATDQHGLDGPRSETGEFSMIITLTGAVSGAECACETPAAPAGHAHWILLASVLGLGVLVRRRL
jgi:MYXO-CTERM domain-containing protein